MSAMSVLTRRRFTVDDYYRMAETGILRAEDRVELLDGEIVMMSPINPPHASVVASVTPRIPTQAFRRRIDLS